MQGVPQPEQSPAKRRGPGRPKKRRTPEEIIKKLNAIRPSIQKQIPPWTVFGLIENDEITRILLAFLMKNLGRTVPISRVYYYIRDKYNMNEQTARMAVLRRAKILFKMGLIGLLPPMRPFTRSYSAVYTGKPRDIVGALYAQILKEAIQTHTPVSTLAVDPIEEQAIMEFARYLGINRKLLQNEDKDKGNTAPMFLRESILSNLDAYIEENTSIKVGRPPKNRGISVSQ